MILVIKKILQMLHIWPTTTKVEVQFESTDCKQNLFEARKAYKNACDAIEAAQDKLAADKNNLAILEDDRANFAKVVFDGKRKAESFPAMLQEIEALKISTGIQELELPGIRTATIQHVQAIAFAYADCLYMESIRLAEHLVSLKAERAELLSRLETIDKTPYTADIVSKHPWRRFVPWNPQYIYQVPSEELTGLERLERQIWAMKKWADATRNNEPFTNVDDTQLYEPLPDYLSAPNYLGE